mgnify:CR=1 FL=1
MTQRSTTVDLVYCSRCSTPLAKRSSQGVGHGVYPLVGVATWYERSRMMLKCSNAKCGHVNKLTIGRTVR